MINIKKMARTQNSEFINNVNEYHRFWGRIVQKTYNADQKSSQEEMAAILRK